MATPAMALARNYYMVNYRAEAIIDKHFGADEPRSSLLDLERNASLTLQFGHPHLTDGWRPTMPNYVQVGMRAKCISLEAY